MKLVIQLELEIFTRARNFVARAKKFFQNYLAKSNFKQH